MQQPESVIGRPIFREMDGAEYSEVCAHDLEEMIIKMLASGEFKQKAKDLFLRSGRFGLGACFPVVHMTGQVHIKVYTSIEAERSKEKLPAPFTVDLDIQAGELREDSQLITTGHGPVERTIGTEVSNAVDKVRREVGLVSLVPERNKDGYIVNSPVAAEIKTADYKARVEKRRETMARQKAEKEAAQANEAERERIAKESEARNA